MRKRGKIGVALKLATIAVYFCMKRDHESTATKCFQASCGLPKALTVETNVHNVVSL